MICVNMYPDMSSYVFASGIVSSPLVICIVCVIVAGLQECLDSVSQYERKRTIKAEFYRKRLSILIVQNSNTTIKQTVFHIYYVPLSLL